MSFTRWMDGDIPADEADAIYKEIQERVAAIDHEDGLQNAYNAWGLFWDDNEPAHANQHLQIALRRGLNEGEALRVLAGLARRTGHAEAALWFGERAVAIDPTCENCIWQTTENLFYFLPQWDNLRDDPRWAEFREQVGLPEKKTEVLDFAPVLKYTQ